MADAMEVKESLVSRKITPPTPPQGATKEARLKEAHAHLRAVGVINPEGEPTGVASGLEMTVSRHKDKVHGHDVEEYHLAQTVNPITAQPRVLTAKEDPGNMKLRGDLTVEHQPAAPQNTRGKK